MKRPAKIAVAVAAALGLGAALAVFAHPGAMGPGMMQGMAPGMIGGQHDEAFRADMGLVHDMLTNHESIRRTVTNLPNGIRTVTESDDPKAAQAIKAHVASMAQRLKDGREFNLFSPTIPVLFENPTEKGSAFVQTSDDPKVVDWRRLFARLLGAFAPEALL